VDVLVGRQPILDRNQNTVAYELLFRSGNGNAFDGSDGTAATSAVLANACLTIGCNRVLGKKKGFVNFTRDLLLEGRALTLPRDRLVIEILEDVEPDAEVIRSCQELRAAGYTIALDDVTAAATDSPLLACAHYAKIDWMDVQRADRRWVCEQVRKTGTRLLAEKVETKEEFEAALSYGCELFQGFYFARPEILAAREVPSSKLACLRLLAEIRKPDLEFDRIEALVAADIGLTKKLLFFVNSAMFTLQYRVESLAQAFSYLGEEGIRKWVLLAALPQMADGKPGELVTASLVRARFCELAAEHASMRDQSGSSFLVGLLSLLDAMVGRPLPEMLGEMGLDQRLTEAILGEPGASVSPLRGFLEMATALERSDFDRVLKLAPVTGVQAADAGELYIEAMNWADALPR